MLDIGGELAFILKDIDYSSKNELLEKLRKMREDLTKYPKEERKLLRPILSVSLQQAFYTSEWELKSYKNYCNYRSEYGKQKNVESAN